MPRVEHQISRRRMNINASRVKGRREKTRVYGSAVGNPRQVEATILPNSNTRTYVGTHTRTYTCAAGEFRGIAAL